MKPLPHSPQKSKDFRFLFSSRHSLQTTRLFFFYLRKVAKALDELNDKILDLETRPGFPPVAGGRVVEGEVLPKQGVTGKHILVSHNGPSTALRQNSKNPIKRETSNPKPTTPQSNALKPFYCLCSGNVAGGQGQRLPESCAAQGSFDVWGYRIQSLQCWSSCSVPRPEFGPNQSQNQTLALLNPTPSNPSSRSWVKLARRIPMCRWPFPRAALLE